MTESGIRSFEAHIRNLRQGTEETTPWGLLASEEHSEALADRREVEQERAFGTRYDLGRYLVESFEGVRLQPYIGDRGFWTWLALLWFDQLCPAKKGQRRPSQPYNYVLSRNYNHRPRHSVYMTWQLVDRYGEDSRFMLCKEPSTRGELTEQLMARQDILSAEGVVRLASQLYFDPVSGVFKRGSAARKSPGCVARYIAWLQQRELTYDIFSTTREDLERMLPVEFRKFQAAQP
ncbi:MAG: hypothetical protein ACK6A8_12030 [Planctomycetota bacterium]